jgi:EmrB/QacA subfamily drug resistance transporter
LSKIALLVAATFFMEFLDATILNPALPLMARTMGVRAIDLNVGVSIYALTIAVFILPSGWLAERFGARRVFTSAIVIFTVSSLACAFANHPLAFDIARAFQGFGGAMMVPVGRVIVLRSTAKSDLMRAIALLTWPGLTAPLLGPPLGGYLAQAVSWRAIFLVNVPLGIVGAVLAWAWTPTLEPSPRRPFDALGFIFAGGALCCALIALDQLSGGGGPWVVLALCAAAALLSAAYIVHARSHAHPLISVRPFAYRTFRHGMQAGMLARVAISAVPFVLPLMFQLGMGYDPLRAGLTLTPLFLGNLGIKPLTTPILRRFGFRNVLVGNAVLQAAAMLGCATIDAATPPLALAVLLCVAGASRSMQFTALGTLPFADVPPEDMSVANTIFSVSFQAGLAFGIGLAAAAIKLGALVKPDPAIASFHFAFVALAFLMLIAAFGHWRLEPDAGAAVSRPRAA